MSGRWIKLGDTRVNVEAQASSQDAQTVVTATLRLYSPSLCPSDHWNDGTDFCADCGADLQAPQATP